MYLVLQFSIDSFEITQESSQGRVAGAQLVFYFIFFINFVIKMYLLPQFETVSCNITYNNIPSLIHKKEYFRNAPGMYEKNVSRMRQECANKLRLC